MYRGGEEQPSSSERTKFIDLYIPATKVLIEQKDSKKDLTKSYSQSGGLVLSPFEQAKRYYENLPFFEKGQYIVTCNFKEFHVYDMNLKVPEQVIKLEDLENEIYRLDFLVKKDAGVLTKEEKLSVDAGNLIGDIYRHLLTLYKNPEDPKVASEINKLCVRLAFCLYAEDAGLFGEHSAFYKYLSNTPAEQMNGVLQLLFKVLDTKYEDRSINLGEKLSEFPYVNGSLFSDPIEIPQLDETFKDLLLNKASIGFDWKDISPTIFGAIFESTINPETRRSGGMHYTSQDNIHKVIDPLFLRDLREEFNRIKNFKKDGNRINRLKEFQKELGNLKFLDPACGSGNFLTETFLCLRRLENDVMREIYGGQTSLQLEELKHPIYVTLDQFYGIEISEFAVAVAQTALWIADLQMKKETELIIQSNLDYLPLVSYNHIRCANALRIDWNEVVPAGELFYIMGNPPFAGKKEQTKEQKLDLEIAFGESFKGTNTLDYVCGWYVKACDYINSNESITCSFVSTNSITQGEQAPVLWNYLFNKKIVINFAYTTFVWNSEAMLKAHVHCVIIGFSKNDISEKIIYGKDQKVTTVKNINPYLIDAPNIFLNSRNSCLCNVQEIIYGSMPIDDGNLIIENKEEYDEFIKENGNNKLLIREYLGGEELLNNKKRWCIWLNEVSPELYKHSKLIMDRINKNKLFRENSNREQTKKMALTPYLFGEIRQPSTDMLVIPKVSSGTRKYLPIGYISPDKIINGCALIIPSASLYTFSILNSIVHNSWMRIVCGRMKSDYVYSNKIVYNNFIWPEVNDSQKEKATQTAQAILDARALYPNSSLADLYDPLTMPIELLKAHEANDIAVLSLYGLAPDSTEEQIVAHLMELYKKKVDELEPEKKTSSVAKKPRKKKEQIQSELSVESSQSLSSNNSVNKSQSDSKNDDSIASSDITNKEIISDSSEKKKEPMQTSLFDDYL